MDTICDFSLGDDSSHGFICLLCDIRLESALVKLAFLPCKAHLSILTLSVLHHIHR